MHSDSNDNKKKRGIGLRFAWNGIIEVLQHERNFRVHIIAVLLVVCTGLLLKLTTGEWALIVLVIGFVLAMEMVNTVIETLLDYVNPAIHPTAKVIKDVSAGVVLIAAITAVIIGLLIFLPKLYSLF
ncbi:diacylglycerol kinase family protein [Lentibacillus sp. L22]|uniref:diacylglycerol kinase family protein n=1 Tax=Lentibacillus TaxID=175304 RepID=UPI0022B09A52|nr:diacylglycerol kinase family protein [Lentibacillus daqui]